MAQSILYFLVIYIELNNDGLGKLVRLPTKYSYSAGLARPAGIGVQPIRAVIPRQNAPHMRVALAGSVARPSGRPQATAASPRTRSATDAAAAARRLPPPPLPVRCPSSPTLSCSLLFPMAHFLPSSRFIPSGLRDCVDSILRHPRGTLNRGMSPSRVWPRMEIPVSFYCALSTVNSAVDVDYVI